MKIIKDGKVEPVVNQQMNVCMDMEDSIFDFEKDLDIGLSLIKPVLKRSLYHQGQPVIVTFKSFEVWLI